MPPIGNKVQRITGFGGMQNSSFFDITIWGGFHQLDAVRAELRPQRKGLGAF